MFGLLSKLFNRSKKEGSVQQESSGLFDGMFNEEIVQLLEKEIVFSKNKIRGQQCGAVMCRIGILQCFVIQSNVLLHPKGALIGLH